VRLRLFRAPTMAEAMAQVRGELGGDALILGTKRVAGGVEVTAGLQPEDDAPPPPLAPPRHPAGGRHDDGGRDAILAWHGVPDSMRRRLSGGPLPFALSASLRFASLPLQKGDPPLLLVGPPGAGKTLTVARLATRLVLAGMKPLILTADGRRAGATEQLAAFTRLLGLELKSAAQPDILSDILSRPQGGAPVLVDCYGTDPFARADLLAVRALAEAAVAELAVVVPAGLDAAEAGEIAAAYRSCQAKFLVATRLDLSRRLGGVLAAAGSGLALAEFGVGPGAADGLITATPSALAQRLLAAAGGFTPNEALR